MKATTALGQGPRDLIAESEQTFLYIHELPELIAYRISLVSHISQGSCQLPSALVQVESKLFQAVL